MKKTYYCLMWLITMKTIASSVDAYRRWKYCIAIEPLIRWLKLRYQINWLINLKFGRRAVHSLLIYTEQVSPRWFGEPKSIPIFGPSTEYTQVSLVLDVLGEQCLPTFLRLIFPPARKLIIAKVEQGRDFDRVWITRYLISRAKTCRWQSWRTANEPAFIIANNNEKKLQKVLITINDEYPLWWTPPHGRVLMPTPI